jgi:hypothetical protein
MLYELHKRGVDFTLTPSTASAYAQEAQSFFESVTTVVHVFQIIASVA